LNIFGRLVGFHCLIDVFRRKALYKFDKKLFATKKSIETFIMMAKTYFATGGQQLSINVLDRQLFAPQKNPVQYKNLIVRVGGYSDYFCNISPDLQQNVIDRSEFSV